LAAAIGVAGVAGCTPQTVIQNSVPAANAPSHGITVNGVGKANGTPNVARVTVGVEVRAATAEVAIADVNARVAQVIAAVKQAGVADADVRTATLSLNFERVYEPPQPVEMAPSKAKPTAEKPESAPAPAPRLPQGFYNAVNNVELTIRNLDAAGNVVSAATSAGADQVFGIRFEIEDTSALQAEARSQAVADARQRAERLAQLAGVKLGPAVSILETDGGSGAVPGYAMMKTAAAPIERGELTVTSSVQIVYALGE
jgi:uncharacterized protein